MRQSRRTTRMLEYIIDVALQHEKPRSIAVVFYSYDEATQATYKIKMLANTRYAQ
jgi:hypothetical protein